MMEKVVMSGFKKQNFKIDTSSGIKIEPSVDYQVRLPRQDGCFKRNAKNTVDGVGVYAADNKSIFSVAKAKIKENSSAMELNYFNNDFQSCSSSSSGPSSSGSETETIVHAEPSFDRIEKALPRKRKCEEENNADGNSQTALCLIDQDPLNYQKLGNATQYKYIEVDMVANNSVPSIENKPSYNIDWIPLKNTTGVQKSITFDTPRIQTGMLIFQPTVVKPFEKVSGGDLILFVMAGCVQIKSSKYNLGNNNDPYLMSEEVPSKSTACIGEDVTYSIENWRNETATIAYTLIKHSEKTRPPQPCQFN